MPPETQLPSQFTTTRPCVILLATGGTIAGMAESGTQAGYTFGQVGVAAMIDAVPGIEKHRVRSPQLTFFRIGIGESEKRLGVGPSWFLNWCGFRSKTGPFFGLKSMFLGSKRAV